MSTHTTHTATHDTERSYDRRYDNGYEPRAVLLASARSTYLVGPVSGLQLGAVLAAIVLPVFVGISQIPGWLFVILLIWQIALISAIRINGRNGWALLAGLWRSVQRDTPQAANYTPPSETALITPTPLVIPESHGKRLWSGGAPGELKPSPSADNNPPNHTRGEATKKVRALFAAAPGRVGKATVLTTPHGDLFILPRPGGQTKPGRVTAAWSITGPGYALLPGRDQETAIDAWAIAINRIAALPGIVGVSVHERADTTTGLAHAHTWHDANADDASVPVAAREYAELLATVDARDPSCVIAVTFDPRKTPGKLDGIPALVEEVPPILGNAGLTLHARLDANDVQHSILDLARGLTDRPALITTLAVAPVFPAFTDTSDMTSVMNVHGTWVHHSAVVALTATSVGVTGDVLAPLFTARTGVETTVALTIRPLPTEQTQARARARHVKLRRQRAAAENSSMTGLLIDTHKLDQEMQTLHALGADAARGSVETELVITVTITGDDPGRVRTVRAALVRDAAPLHLTTVAYPAPTVMFTRAPLGGLL